MKYVARFAEFEMNVTMDKDKKQPNTLFVAIGVPSGFIHFRLHGIADAVELLLLAYKIVNAVKGVSNMETEEKLLVERARERLK